MQTEVWTNTNNLFLKSDFIHFWSVTLVNIIKTTSFTPPSVINLHLLFAHAFTCFGFLVNHLQKAHQLFKGNYHIIFCVGSVFLLLDEIIFRQ
jgi:hypothetical protein